MSVQIASSSLEPLRQRFTETYHLSVFFHTNRQSNGMSEMTRKTVVFHLRRSFMRCLFLLLGTC